MPDDRSTPEVAAQPRSSDPPPCEDRRLFFLRLRRFALLLLVLWAILTGLHQALPNLRPGARLVYETKQEVVRSGRLFREGASIRVAVFGNSKILSGFIPRIFHELGGADLSAFNLGLPNSRDFLGELDTLCRRGEAPTHVLLTMPWPEEGPPAFDVFHPIGNDRDLIYTLAPFRDLPRYSMLFLLRSIRRGGPVAYYRAGSKELDGMLAAYGFHFIESQSHFSNDRLPDDFSLDSDTPDALWPRRLVAEAPGLASLVTLADRCDLKVAYVPVMFRQGQYAVPPEVNPESRAVLGGHPRLALLGPDYWLLPNRLFSDPVHLNPTGADIYTRRLWALVEPLLRSSSADR